MEKNLFNAIVKLSAALVVWYALPVIVIILDCHYHMSSLECGWLAFIGTMLVYLFYTVSTVTGVISIICKVKKSIEWSKELANQIGVK